MGYTPEVESCSNQVQYPDLYKEVPFRVLGDGMCEFYYSPEHMEASESCLNLFLSGDLEAYFNCVSEALKN